MRNQEKQIVSSKEIKNVEKNQYNTECRQSAIND